MSLAHPLDWKRAIFMRLTPSLNQERWEWFGAGDPEVAPKILRASTDKNSAPQILFEAGLVLLIPLLLATVIEVVLTR
jgi:hypothetical protein